MAAQGTKMALEPDQLNPTDESILDELQSGRCTPAHIAEKHEYSSGNVRNRMTRLAEHGHVEGIGGGLYVLLDDPRGGGERDDEADLRARLQDALEARDDAQARADRLAEELADCQDLLEDARAQAVDVDVGRIQDGLRSAKTALEGQDPDVDMATGEIEALLEEMGDVE